MRKYFLQKYASISFLSATIAFSLAFNLLSIPLVDFCFIHFFTNYSFLYDLLCRYDSIASCILLSSEATNKEDATGLLANHKLLATNIKETIKGLSLDTKVAATAEGTMAGAAIFTYNYSNNVEVSSEAINYSIAIMANSTDYREHSVSLTNYTIS